jgi:hypothetical protein
MQTEEERNHPFPPAFIHMLTNCTSRGLRAARARGNCRDRRRSLLAPLLFSTNLCPKLHACSLSLSFSACLSLSLSLYIYMICVCVCVCVCVCIYINCTASLPLALLASI